MDTARRILLGVSRRSVTRPTIGRARRCLPLRSRERLRCVKSPATVTASLQTETVLTIGVDLAAQNANTSMASIEWSTGRAWLTEIRAGDVTDEQIIEAAKRAHKVAIDCPFGWPEGFFEFIHQHRNGDVALRELSFSDWSREIAFRRTDFAVHDQVGIWPLSVMSNYLGRTALRCAALLSRLSDAGVPVDRTGACGPVVECYPAASLAAWSFKRGKASIKWNMRYLLAADCAPWLDLGDQKGTFETNEHAFDALIASLTARAVALNRATAPRNDYRAAAQIEGWIWVPHTESLEGLVNEMPSVI